jgi:hypothetical protein
MTISFPRTDRVVRKLESDDLGRPILVYFGCLGLFSELAEGQKKPALGFPKTRDRPSWPNGERSLPLVAAAAVAKV